MYTYGSILLSKISPTQKDTTSCIASFSGGCEQIPAKQYLKTEKDLFGLQFKVMQLAVVRELGRQEHDVHSQKAKHRAAYKPSKHTPWLTHFLQQCSNSKDFPNSTIRCVPTNLQSISHLNHRNHIYSPMWNIHLDMRGS